MMKPIRFTLKDGAYVKVGEGKSIKTRVNASWRTANEGETVGKSVDLRTGKITEHKQPRKNSPPT